MVELNRIMWTDTCPTCSTPCVVQNNGGALNWYEPRWPGEVAALQTELLHMQADTDQALFYADEEKCRLEDELERVREILFRTEGENTFLHAEVARLARENRRLAALARLAVIAGVEGDEHDR